MNSVQIQSKAEESFDQMTLKRRVASIRSYRQQWLDSLLIKIVGEDPQNSFARRLINLPHTKGNTRTEQFNAFISEIPSISPRHLDDVCFFVDGYSTRWTKQEGARLSEAFSQYFQGCPPERQIANLVHLVLSRLAHSKIFAQSTADLFLSLTKSPTFYDHAPSLTRLGEILAAGAGPAFQKITDQARSILASANLPAKDFLDGTSEGFWGLHESRYVLGHYLPYNLNTLYQLGDMEPKAPRFLYERCGIRNFGRYFPEALVAQYHYLKKPDTATQPVRVLTTVYDNEHLSFMSSFALDQLFHEASRLGNAMIPLYCEFSSKEELLKLTRRHGKLLTKNNVIAINAHGNYEGIDICLQENLCGKELAQTLVKIIRNTQCPDNTLILNCCSLGKSEESPVATLMQALSDDPLKVSVLATRYNRPLSKLSFEKQRGGVSINASFSHGGTLFFSNRKGYHPA